MNNEQKYNINLVFCSVIHEVCSDFAINNMQENDFILIHDAREIIEGVKVQRGEDSSDGYTIKRSCKEKYNDFYNKKLEHIIQKFLKDNT